MERFFGSDCDFGFRIIKGCLAFFYVYSQKSGGRAAHITLVCGLCDCTESGDEKDQKKVAKKEVDIYKHR